MGASWSVGDDDDWVGLVWILIAGFGWLINSAGLDNGRRKY